jgi:hypothetical protein
MPAYGIDTDRAAAPAARLRLGPRCGRWRPGRRTDASGRKVLASDIAPQRQGFRQLDFLTRTEPPFGVRGSTLITNPPFDGSGLGDRFLHRTLELLDAGHLAAAVLLQRADAGGDDGRAEAFNRAAQVLWGVTNFRSLRQVASYAIC